MKILFDASTPAQLARFLQRHSVTHAARLGWHELSNGKLLAAAEQAAFDAVITCDKNMRFQHNVRNLELAIVILPTNH